MGIRVAVVDVVVHEQSRCDAVAVEKASVSATICDANDGVLIIISCTFVDDGYILTKPSFIEHTANVARCQGAL